MMFKDTLRYIVLGGIFILPFLPLVVANSLFFPYITGKNFLFRVIVEIVFASWVLLALADARFRPRFSWILGGFLWFVGIVFLADVFGVSPHKSLWSNYERMEGFVTIVHLLMYFVVVGSVLVTEKLWRRFWDVSIAVAILMSLYAFGQMSGMFMIGQGDIRVDARLGNAAYLAIYMLFHVFLAVMLAITAPQKWRRYAYIGLAAMFVFVLIQTATRGTILALAGGAFLASGYIALFERENKLARKIAIGAVTGVILISSLFVLVKDQDFIQENKVLSRLSTISLSEGGTRFKIWSIALEGFKERPLLGWGQENFNYVFNKHYRPELYTQEPWFDRTHNVIFDWLIAAGLLGLLAYLFLIGISVFYVAVLPLIKKTVSFFSVSERGLLLGLIAGYVAHNMLVFDNLISYFLFASVIAMIHARVAVDAPLQNEWKVSPAVFNQIALPVGAVALCFVLYFVNAPGYLAARDLIKVFSTPYPNAQLQAIESSLERGSFAEQEIREQLVRIAQNNVQDPNLALLVRQEFPALSTPEITTKTEEIRTRFATLAEEELEMQQKETPDDARVLMFLATVKRFIGKPAEAVDVLIAGRMAAPEKQQVLFDLGLAYLQAGNVPASVATMKEAFELAPDNTQARMMYAVAAIYSGDNALLQSLITPQYEESYVRNDMVMNALYTNKRYADLISFLRARITLMPSDVQVYVALASVQAEMGDRAAAIRTVEEAIAVSPDFKAQGEQIITALRTGT